MPEETTQNPPIAPAPPLATSRRPWMETVILDSLAIGGAINYFSSSPKVLYLCALALCFSLWRLARGAHQRIGAVVFTFLLCIVTNAYVTSALKIGAADGAKLDAIHLKLDKSDVERRAESSRAEAARTAEHAEMMKAREADHIPGTKTTHSFLRNQFPFGYLVISGRDGQWTFKPPIDAHRRITADWDAVKVTADFATHQMIWDIPEISFFLGNQKVGYGNHIVSPGFVIDPKFIYPIQFFFEPGQPDMFVGALNDDQRFPVWVLGFRIAEKRSL